MSRRGVWVFVYPGTTPKIDCPSIMRKISRCAVSVSLVSSISMPSMARTLPLSDIVTGTLSMAGVMSLTAIRAIILALTGGMDPVVVVVAVPFPVSISKNR